MSAPPPTGVVVLVNTGDKPLGPPPADPLEAFAGGAFADPKPLGDGGIDAPLEPGEVRLLSVTRTKPVADRARRNERALTEALKAPRVAIERLSPSVDGGPFRSSALSARRSPSMSMRSPTGTTSWRRSCSGRPPTRRTGRAYR